jgi:hypothetical protein
MTIVETFLNLVGYGVLANMAFALTFCFLRLRKINKTLNRSLE